MRGTRVGDHDLGEGLKLAATAVASAVVVAALVITLGGPLIERQGSPAGEADVALRPVAVKR